MPTIRNAAVAGRISGANPSAVNTPPIAARISVTPLGSSGARPVNVLALLGASTSSTPEITVPIRTPRRRVRWITWVHFHGSGSEDGVQLVVARILVDAILVNATVTYTLWRCEMPPSLPVWVSEHCDEIHNIHK